MLRQRINAVKNEEMRIHLHNCLSYSEMSTTNRSDLATYMYLLCDVTQRPSYHLLTAHERANICVLQGEIML